jgi:uncharacterized protein
MEPRRLRRLPRAEVHGIEVPVAQGLRARLLGLALLPRERAGPGLLIPRCSSIHTFGMRFALDLVFLDDEGRALRELPGVLPRRIARFRGAAAVLETPSASYTPHDTAEGGEVASAGSLTRHAAGGQTARNGGGL